MLRCLSGILGYRISAVDGEVGKVHDFYFDDVEWIVRYVVVEAGSLLNRNRVLISPAMVGQPDWKEQVLPISLTVEQVKTSPEVDTDKPVSRQQEQAIAAAYAMMPHWVPDAVVPVPLTPRHPVLPEPAKGDAHLRSAKHVTGYRIHASDGDLGHVDDFIADDECWSIQYIAVATGEWLPGRKVLVAPRWIESISWDAREVTVNLSREGVKRSPEYDPTAPINREYEVRLYDYYGRPKYWE